MGNHAAEVAGLLPFQGIKVHARMCSELLQIVIKISKVLPEIEDARPRCTLGMQSLCLLNDYLNKSKFLLQQCSESSVLYLALTGETTLARCKKYRSSFEQNLNQIQNMVPNVLAAKISGIVAELRTTEFHLDLSVAEAGKLLEELLRRSSSTANDFVKEAALEDIHNAALRLDITSQRALLIEIRSIKKMANNLGESESRTSKRAILLFFLDLLKKYGKSMPLEKRVNGPSDLVHPLPFASPYCFSREVELCVDYRPNDAAIGMISRPTPPEHGITPLQTPSLQSWETSSNSIASMTSSMYDLNLPVDFSNISLGSCHSDHTNATEFSKPMGTLHEDDIELLSKFSELPWDSKLSAVEDVKKLLKHCNESRSAFPLEQFTQLLCRFLKDAYDHPDVEAQMTGCLLLLELVQKSGSSTSCINLGTYVILASLLDTELSKQALSILVVLSTYPQCVLNIVSSGAVTGILNILDDQIIELLEPALRILSNLSSNEDIHPIIPSESIPKLIPLFKHHNLARHCMAILKNMPDTFSETEGCIASIVKVLEVDDRDAQEDALSILLRLCSQRVEYSKIVLEEGDFSTIVSLTKNASAEGQATATELVRILEEVSDASPDSCDANAVVETNTHQPEKDAKKCQKQPGFLGKVFAKKRR